MLDLIQFFSRLLASLLVPPTLLFAPSPIFAIFPFLPLGRFGVFLDLDLRPRFQVLDPASVFLSLVWCRLDFLLVRPPLAV